MDGSDEPGNCEWIDDVLMGVVVSHHLRELVADLQPKDGVADAILTASAPPQGRWPLGASRVRVRRRRFSGRLLPALRRAPPGPAKGETSEDMHSQYYEMLQRRLEAAGIAVENLDLPGLPRRVTLTENLKRLVDEARLSDDQQ
jgi:hypothetical protein